MRATCTALRSNFLAMLGGGAMTPRPLSISGQSPEGGNLHRVFFRRRPTYKFVLTLYRSQIPQPVVAESLHKSMVSLPTRGIAKSLRRALHGHDAATLPTSLSVTGICEQASPDSEKLVRLSLGRSAFSAGAVCGGWWLAPYLFTIPLGSGNHARQQSVRGSRPLLLEVARCGSASTFNLILLL